MEKKVDRYGVCAAKETITFNEDDLGNGDTYERGKPYVFEHRVDSDYFYVKLGFGGLWFSPEEFGDYFVICRTVNMNS